MATVRGPVLGVMTGLPRKRARTSAILSAGPTISVCPKVAAGKGSGTQAGFGKIVPAMSNEHFAELAGHVSPITPINGHQFRNSGPEVLISNDRQ